MSLGFRIESTLSADAPRDQLLLDGMRTAVARVGSHLDPSSPQVLSMVDDADCPPSVRARTTIPSDGTVKFCSTFTRTMPYDQPQALLTAMHELGHVLSQDAVHVPCDAPEPSVMMPDVGCSGVLGQYSPEDWALIFGTGRATFGR